MQGVSDTGKFPSKAYSAKQVTERYYMLATSWRQDQVLRTKAVQGLGDTTR